MELGRRIRKVFVPAKDHVFLDADYSQIELAWCAYMDEQTYQDKLNTYPDMKDIIEANTFKENDKRIVCYTKIRTENRDFYKDFEQYEIYNGRVSYEDFKQIVFTRLKAWNQDNMIYECSLFQNIVEGTVFTYIHQSHT